MAWDHFDFIAYLYQVSELGAVQDSMFIKQILYIDMFSTLDSSEAFRCAYVAIAFAGCVAVQTACYNTTR